jgi:hypothetical protein
MTTATAIANPDLAFTKYSDEIHARTNSKICDSSDERYL